MQGTGGLPRAVPLGSVCKLDGHADRSLVSYTGGLLLTGKPVCLQDWILCWTGLFLDLVILPLLGLPLRAELRSVWHASPGY